MAGVVVCFLVSLVLFVGLGVVFEARERETRMSPGAHKRVVSGHR
jgi:hypothetical protein